MIFLSTLSFAFKIDELEFGKILNTNQKMDKVFTLENNNTETKIYKISVEGDKNVKITPNLLNLQPHQSKKFKLEVTAKKPKGEHSYFLIITEVRKEALKKEVGINKIIKIKQKYTIK